MTRSRRKKVRELSEAEHEELDALIRDQRVEDRWWVTPNRRVVSLDALLAEEEEGLTLRDFLLERPDYTPFGLLRMMMEQRDIVPARRRYRRKVGWRIKRPRGAA